MLGTFARRYVARYLPVYALGLLCLAATNWLTIAIPRWQKEVFDELALGRRAAVVERHALWIAAAAVLVIVVRSASRILFFNPGRTIEFRLRNDMLARLLGMSPAFYRRWPIGDLMARATDDAAFVRALVGFALIMALNMVLAAGMALVQMWRTDPWLTATCALPAIAALFALRKGVTWSMALMKQTQVALGQVSSAVLEAYKGIAVIQGAAAEPAFLARFDRASDRYTALNLRQAAVRTFLMPVVGLVGHVCIFLLLWQGGAHVIEGRMTLGDMAAYASYVAVLVGALASGGWVLGVLQRGLVSLRRCWEVVEWTADLADGDLPLPDSGQGARVEVADLVVAHADSPADPVLRGVSFTVLPGQVVGVCGPVGSGKSTLVACLARLMPARSGRVFIDGIDLARVRSADLRRAVAVVPQEAFLFSRPLRDNVAFSAAGGVVDPARADAALADAQLAAEAARLPQGLDTVVGERGMLLSGGQRQRAQLARALYHGGRLLILDDALSAVDHDTEERMLQALRDRIAANGVAAAAGAGTRSRPAGGDQPSETTSEVAPRPLSAVVVSHRLSALRHADLVLVLGDPAGPLRGQIVERGTHAELIARGGPYAAVWAAQQAELGSPEPLPASEPPAGHRRPAPEGR